MPFAPGVAKIAARRSLISALLLAALSALGTIVAAPPASAATTYSGGFSSGLEAEIPESTETPTPVETETGEVGTGVGEPELGTAPKAGLVGGRAIAPAGAPA